MNPNGDDTPCIIVAAHCNENRINEYGTARQADYKSRGNRAREYTRFMIDELIPYIRSEFSCTTDPAKNIIAGFSLSALSALDIAWATPSVLRTQGRFR